MDALLCLAPDVWPDPIEGDGIVLLAPDGFLLAEGSLPAAVFAELSDRPMSTSELNEALGPIYGSDSIDAVIAGLLADRFIEELDLEIPSRTARRWRTLPVSFRAIRAALASQGVAVMGDGPIAAAVRGALTDWGIQNSDAPTALTIVVAAFMRDASLEDVDVRMRAAGQSWVLVAPAGHAIHTRWTLPGETACWRCLNTALREALPFESPPNIAPSKAIEIDTALVAAACEHLALQIALWLVDEATRPTAGAIHVYSALFQPPDSHPVAASAHCNCQPSSIRQARPERDALRASVAVRGYLSPAQWRHIQSLVDPLTGLFRQLTAVAPPDTDMGSVHIVQHPLACRRPSVHALRLNAGARSVGKGEFPADSIRSALLEAVERHSGVWRTDIPTRRASYADVADIAWHPDDLMGFMPDAFSEQGDPASIHPVLQAPAPLDEHQPISWLQGHDLVSDAPVLIPAALSFYDHPDLSLGFAIADSNGCAAGATYASALMGALLESIERDAVARWWYPMAPRPGIDLSRATDPYAQRQTEVHDRVGRDLWALDLTDDLAVPVVAAVSRSRTDVRDIVLGFGSAIDPQGALKGALLEVTQVLAIRAASTSPSPVFDDGAGVVTDPEVMRCLYPSPEAAPRPAVPMATVGHLLDRLADAGVPVILIDQSHPRIGIPVVRAFLPGMAHFWRRLGARRMREVLEDTGRRNPFSIVM